jgi:hypothetical protein
MRKPNGAEMVISIGVAYLEEVLGLRLVISFASTFVRLVVPAWWLFLELRTFFEDVFSRRGPPARLRATSVAVLLCQCFPAGDRLV